MRGTEIRSQVRGRAGSRAGARRATGLCAALLMLALVLPAVAGAAGNWTEGQLPARTMSGQAPYEVGLSGVSCAGESLCVAVGGYDTIASSASPGAGAGTWHVATPATPTGLGACTESIGGQEHVLCGPIAALESASCASTSLCVVVSYEGFAYASTDPTGGASAWHVVGSPPGAGGLGGVGCAGTSLCVAGDSGGNLLSSTAPTGAAAGWSVTNGGGAVLIDGVTCPTATRCVAVDNNGDVITSTDPTGGAWRFENLVPFHPTGLEGEIKNAIFGASCGSPSLCVLVGADSRIFTSTEPFPPAATTSPPGASGPGAPHAPPRRPRTFFKWKERSWHGAVTRRRHVRANFRFYSRTQISGFECKRDRAAWGPCRSLRYWVGHGKHTLQVRATGPTGLPGPAAIVHFRVTRPRLGRVS